MKRALLTLLPAVVACTASMQKTSSETPARAATNPFFDSEWQTPYGAPPFERVTIAHYAPALDVGMATEKSEIAAIANAAEAPTFANTIEALERAGADLERTAAVFFNLAGSNTNDQMQAIRTDYAPKLSQHSDEIYLNAALFKRVSAVHEQRAQLGLRPDQDKLVVDYYKRFIRAGAQLDGPAKERLTKINARLAAIFSKFGDNLRKENADYALIIDDDKDLAGLPEEVVAQGTEAAKEKKQEGKWAFTLVRSSVTPFLQYAKNRALRKEIYMAYTTRGAHGDDKDNRGLLKETAVLRAERAQLLGFKSHAHYAIDRNMARTPEAVYELLKQLYDGALARAKEERTALTELLVADLGKDAKLEPWDWWYYAEKVRKARYDLSQDELKPYFQVDQVREGAFDVAGRLFGITFNEVTKDVPIYHEAVKAFDVKYADGQHVGLLYVDYHPRAGKRGGAWMSEFRGQSKIDGPVRPVIVNVGNFPAPAGDKPALLGWDEVQTLFHEFGHALHGLLSNVTYEGQSGTNVKRDYVEFPSQLLENWASRPEVIKKYARHYQSGEAIPDVLIDKLTKAATFNQGFATTELAAASLLDLEWHMLDLEGASKVDDVAAFDAAAMKKIGLIPEIAPRYHSPYFQHIFAGDGYSAGYYVYLWAQVLEADAFAAFIATGDVFDKGLAKGLLDHIFSSGGSDEEMALYGKFRGQKPTVEPLLEKLGLK